MTHLSEPSLLVLHAVRILGFGSVEAVAERAGTHVSEVLRVLTEADHRGWVQHTEFADLEGWSLSEAGKEENERQLAAELTVADPRGTVAEAYRDFLPLNARLLRAVTDWQIRPTDDEAFAANDHADRAWDDRVVDELAKIGRGLEVVNGQLTAVLARFEGYSSRFDSALHKAIGGRRDWIDKTTVDSCHRVWFQLHEDLVATLGIDRGDEHEWS